MLSAKIAKIVKMCLIARAQIANCSRPGGAHFGQGVITLARGRSLWPGGDHSGQGVITLARG